MHLVAKQPNFVFNQGTEEIEELTFIIKQSIHTLNKEITLLRDTSKSSNNSAQNQSHSETVITLLNTKLATTTKDFTDVLQQRTEVSLFVDLYVF